MIRKVIKILLEMRVIQNANHLLDLNIIVRGMRSSKT